MKDYLDLIEFSEQRYHNRFKKISSVIQSIAEIKQKNNWAETLVKVNTKTAMNQRFNYLSKKFSTPPDEAKERILGKLDLVHINHMEKGLRAAKSIGRVAVKNNLGRTLGHGSGFLVSPNLFLTNNHVLETYREAGLSEVELNYEFDINDRIEPYFVFKLRPDKFYQSSPFRELDYTLVAVEEFDINGQKKLSDFGYLPMIQETGKVAIGENLTIIQHPRGEVKQIAMRDNELIDKDDRYLRYKTDTERGSSGSAVFNDQWEVVALHHSGVPQRNNQGDILKKDGGIYVSGVDSDKDIDWIANEGIRISRIVKDVIKKISNASTLEMDMVSMFRSF